MRRVAYLIFYLALGLAVCVATACSDDTEQRIAATCSSRMTLAHDGHDSLAVLLACDQLRAIAKAQSDASSAAAGNAAMMGAAIGASAAVSR